VAISVEHLKPSQPDGAKPIQNSEPGDAPHGLSGRQFATLYAVLKRLISRLHEAIVTPIHVAADLDAALADGGGSPIAEEAQACPLGLDELDTIARTRTGYSFAELTPELQDAVLDLVATGDLTTGKLDLALWLEDLRHHMAA
jgi:hypothetical protein